VAKSIGPEGLSYESKRCRVVGSGFSRDALDHAAIDHHGYAQQASRLKAFPTMPRDIHDGRDIDNRHPCSLLLLLSGRVPRIEIAASDTRTMRPHSQSGTPTMTPTPSRLAKHFTDDDAGRLEELLHTFVEYGGLPLEALDGLLCAVILAPEVILPSEYLPLVTGADAPPWETAEQAQAFFDLLMGMQNHIARRVVREPDESTMPYIATPEEFDELSDDMFNQIDFPIATNWAIGFMIGVGLRGEAWDALAENDEDIRDDIGMIVALLPDEPDEEVELEESAASIDPDRKERLHWSADDAESADDEGPSEPLTMRERLEIIAELPAILQHMNLTRLDALNSREPVRRELKVGRNDPCPCGSGKKYKKCHGEELH
jgi:uncharacterized protein